VYHLDFTFILILILFHFYFYPHIKIHQEMEAQHVCLTCENNEVHSCVSGYQLPNSCILKQK